MNIFIIYALIISLFTPICAMDPMTWVKTCDNHLVALSKQSAAQSALISTLTRYRKYSETKPLAIPVNKAELDFFCNTLTPCTDDINNPLKPGSYQTENLYRTLTPDEYYNLMGIAEKLKARTFYTNLIEQVLPSDCSRLCIPDPQQIESICRSNIIKKNHTKKSFPGNGVGFPDIIISNNGQYTVHNVVLDESGITSTLWNTKTCTTIKNIVSTYVDYLSFSPDSTYIIVREAPNIFVYYNITQDKEYPLTLPDYFNRSCTITISPDSKHIMISGTSTQNNRHTRRHALYSLDANNIPQPVTLNSPHWEEVRSATFHTDNKHIIYNAHRETLQTCLIASPNDITARDEDGQSVAVNTLTINADGTHILTEYYFHDYRDCGKILFNIENLSAITSIEFPNQSCSKFIDLSPLSIPRKKLFTHITNFGYTFELLDTNACTIASHTTKNSSISALAVDNTGNYLASGYTDGTIIIWDLSNVTKCICGKKIIISEGRIEKLTFNDNQLLLSLAKPKTFKKEKYKRGSRLWDVHGNEIINFGVIDICEMSKNGDCIITLTDKLLTTWNLDNEKTDKELNETLKNLTLSQALAFYTQYQEEQELNSRINSSAKNAP